MKEDMQGFELSEHLDIPAIKDIVFACWRKYMPTRKEKYKEFTDWEEKDKINFSSVRSGVPYNKKQAEVYEKVISSFFDTVQTSIRQEESTLKQKDTKQSWNEISKIRGTAIHRCLSTTNAGRPFPLPWKENKIKSLYNNRIQIRAKSDTKEIIAKRKKSLIFWELFLDYIESPDFVTAMRSKESISSKPQPLKEVIAEYTEQKKLSNGTQLDLFLDLTKNIYIGKQDN